MGKVTYAVRKGPRSYQEDYSCHMPIGNSSCSGWLLAVADGHGGQAVAEMIVQEIPKLFQLKDSAKPENALRKLVDSLNKKTAQFSDIGSTLSIACIFENPLTASIAILGDSPVIVLDGEQELHISPEHNIRSNSKELRRVEKRGGICIDGYVFKNDGARGFDYGIQMSRALGDNCLSPVISHKPEIYTIENPRWVLVASDGVFDPAHEDKSVFKEIKEFAIKRASAEDVMQWAEKKGLEDNATDLVWSSD